MAQSQARFLRRLRGGSTAQQRISDVIAGAERATALDFAKGEVLVKDNGQIQCFVCRTRPLLSGIKAYLAHKRGARHRAAISQREQRAAR